jgi:hypothetical protein
MHLIQLTIDDEQLTVEKEKPKGFLKNKLRESLWLSTTIDSCTLSIA